MPDEIVIDLDEGDVAEAKGELIPPNDKKTPYKAKIETVELTKVASGENKGKPMYKVKYRLLSGPGKGRVMFDNLCLWYEARFSLLQIIAALGLPIEKKLRVPKVAQLLNKEVGLVVNHKPDQNDNLAHKVAQRVPWGASGGSSDVAPAGATERVKF